VAVFTRDKSSAGKDVNPLQFFHEFVMSATFGNCIFGKTEREEHPDQVSLISVTFGILIAGKESNKEQPLNPDLRVTLALKSNLAIDLSEVHPLQKFCIVVDLEVSNNGNATNEVHPIKHSRNVVTKLVSPVVVISPATTDIIFVHPLNPPERFTSPVEPHASILITAGALVDPLNEMCVIVPVRTTRYVPGTAYV
jgi:hypothetical protein